MTINDAVANRTIRLLQENHMTQYRLERSAGIVHGAMDRIITGQNTTVTLTTIYKLARAFNMSYLEFLDDDVFRSEELEID